MPRAMPTEPAHRIEAGYKSQKDDAIAHGVLADIREDLLIQGVKEINYVDVYLLRGGFSIAELNLIAEKLMHDPVVQRVSVDAPLFSDFDWEIEVRVRENVTDNIGIAARIGIEDLLRRALGRDESVRSARKYVINGALSEKEAALICTGMLANPLIEEWKITRGEGAAGARKRGNGKAK
ncbi:MAG: hypothetical protein V1676_06230 [Candidatus Diapherotrites archaeon]